MSGGSSGLKVVVLSRSARGGDGPAWGLGQDSKIVEQVLREMHAGGHASISSVDHIDPVGFVGSPRKPRAVDIQIHLEVPCRAAFPWARYNIVVVNPEWWPKTAWNWVCAPVEQGGAHMFVFKSEHARALFPDVDEKRCRVLSWRAGAEISTASATSAASLRREFLYLIGASANKLAAAKAICNAWKPSYPTLRVVGSEKVLSALQTAVSSAAVTGDGERGIVFQSVFASDSERITAQSNTAYHIVASAAEGFGYTFAEAAAVGALPLWTDIPVYKEIWGGILGDVGKICGSGTNATEFRDLLQSEWSTDAICAAVEGLLSLKADDEARLRGALRRTATARIKDFRQGWRTLIAAVVHKFRSLPAVRVPPRSVAAEALPHVAVITLTRNRRRWFANMARNILLSDYPPDKLTWVVADDSDAAGRVDEDIMKFQSAHPRIRVRYVSLPRPLPIGAKRNRACEAAPAECSVFVMMDDDDHYPAGSIAARVAWLLGMAEGKGCIYCSTLPMYDAKNYISAVNVPPLDLAPEERVSEASLAFTRDFWTARKFPGPVSVAEGEGFLAGRIEQTAEIPPEGIIVSFLWGGNATSRRVPDATEPNGCHYGFDDDYFSYISGLVV